MARLTKSGQPYRYEGFLQPQNDSDAANKAYVDNHAGHVDPDKEGYGINISDDRIISVDTEVIADRAWVEGQDYLTSVDNADITERITKNNIDTETIADTDWVKAEFSAKGDTDNFLAGGGISITEHDGKVRIDNLNTDYVKVNDASTSSIADGTNAISIGDGAVVLGDNSIGIGTDVFIGKDSETVEFTITGVDPTDPGSVSYSNLTINGVAASATNSHSFSSGDSIIIYYDGVDDQILLTEDWDIDSPSGTFTGQNSSVLLVGYQARILIGSLTHYNQAIALGEGATVDTERQLVINNIDKVKTPDFTPSSGTQVIQVGPTGTWSFAEAAGVTKDNEGYGIRIDTDGTHNTINVDTDVVLKYVDVNSTLGAADASGGDSVAIGPLADAQGGNAIAIGHHTGAEANDSIHIGSQDDVGGGVDPNSTNGIAIGKGARVFGNSPDGIAIGTGARMTNHEGSIALGKGAEVTMDKQLVIGEVEHVSTPRFQPSGDVGEYLFVDTDGNWSFDPGAPILTAGQGIRSDELDENRIAIDTDVVTGVALNDSVLKVTAVDGDTEDLTISTENNYVTGGSVTDTTLTLTRQGLDDVSITGLPDNNNYVTGGSVSGDTLTLTREGLDDITITGLDTENNYVTGGSVSGTTLTLTREGLDDVTITGLPEGSGDGVKFVIEHVSTDGNNNRIIVTDSETFASLRIDTDHTIHVPRSDHIGPNEIGEDYLESVSIENGVNGRIIFRWTPNSGVTSFDDTFISKRGITLLQLSGSDFDGDGFGILDVSGNPDGSEFLDNQLIFHYNKDKYTGGEPTNLANAVEEVRVLQTYGTSRVPTLESFSSDGTILFPTQNDSDGLFEVNVDTDRIATRDFAEAQKADFGYQNLFTDSTELQRFPTTHDVGHNHFASAGSDLRWYYSQETVFDTDLPVGATIKVNFVSANDIDTPSQEGYYSISSLDNNILNQLFTLNLEHFEGDDPLADRPNAEDDTNHYTFQFSYENRAAGRAFNGSRSGYVPVPSSSERNSHHYLNGNGGWTEVTVVDSEEVAEGAGINVKDTDAGVIVSVDTDFGLEISSTDALRVDTDDLNTVYLRKDTDLSPVAADFIEGPNITIEDSDSKVKISGLGGSHARSVYIEAPDGDRSPLVYIKHNTSGTVDVHTVDSEYAGSVAGTISEAIHTGSEILTLTMPGGQNQTAPFPTDGTDVYIVTDTYTALISGNPNNTGNNPTDNETFLEWDNPTIIAGSSTDHNGKDFSTHTLVSVHTGKLGFTMADTDWIHTNTQAPMSGGDGININDDTEIEVDDGYGLNFDSNRQLQVDLSQIASKSYVQSAVRNATRGEIGEKTDEHTLYLADTEHDQLRFLNDAGVTNNRSFIVNTRGATVYQGIAANDDDLKVVQVTDGSTETVNANASRNWEAVSYNVYEGNKWDDADALTYSSRAFKYNGDAPTHIWNSQESTFANVSFFRNGHNSSSTYQVTARVQLIVVDELEQIRLHDGPQLVAQSDEFEIDLTNGQTQSTESPVRLPSVSESQGTQIHPGQYVALRWACHIDHYDDTGITLTDAPYLVWAGTSGTQTHHAGRADVRTVTYELYLETATGNQYGRLKYGNNTTTPEGIHTIVDNDGQAPYLKVGGGNFASIASDTGGAIAIGPGSVSEANNGVVIGNGANQEGTSGVAIGTNANADLANAIAIGAGSRAGTVGATGGMMTAIGNDSRTTGDRGVAIGHDAWSVGDVSIAIGDNARSDHTYGIAIGGGARTSANFQMAIANIRDVRVTDAAYSPDSDISLITRGWAEANIGGSPYIEVGPTNGADAVATDTDSFAFGGGATTNTAIRSFAIGGNSIVRADAANGVAIGYESIATNNAIAIGRAMADTDFATAIGWNAGGYGAGSDLNFGMGHRSTAIGAFSRTLGDNSVAIGVAAQADGSNSFAMGRFANSDGSHSIAIGRASEAEGLQSIAIGTGLNGDTDAAPQAHGSQSIAIGTNTQANQTNTIAIGANATAAHSNSMAIGAGSTTTQSNQVSFQGGTLDYLVLPSAGGDPVGAPNGAMYVRSTDGRVRVLDGGNWRFIGNT